VLAKLWLEGLSLGHVAFVVFFGLLWILDDSDMPFDHVKTCQECRAIKIK
jgi:hypothetical protein